MISMILMAGLYIVAGVNHFIHPAFYLQIMPGWIPFHDAAVFVSGMCEVVFAFLLLIPVTRRKAAWAIIVLLIAVFPANIQMMLNYLHGNNPGLWVTVIRLPLQALLIWWAYSFTKPPVHSPASSIHTGA